MEFAMGIAAMADSRVRRQRRPKRPVAYLVIVAVCGVIALGSAWEGARPAGKIKVVWRGQPQFVAQGKARDARQAAP